MNTNLLHNIINVLMTAIPALALFDWSVFVSEGTALKIVGALGLAKIMINAWRDGPRGMIQPQPPVGGQPDGNSS
jgi:hypothetical protein